MQKQLFLSFLVRVITCFLLVNGFSPIGLSAQDTTIARTPEEQRELFGYCEKFELMKQLNIPAETADKIGQLKYWYTIQKLKIEANTNDTFAVLKEVDDEMLKRYKALHFSGSQLTTLMNKSGSVSTEPCAIITLSVNHYYDTASAPRVLLLFKTQYKKPLVDKTGINGRQADMLFDIEIWKQKEALSIATIPVTDFNRIRKTVALYNERERRYRVVGITDQQIEAVIDFFNQHQLGPKK
jgi:hypothetical protein